MIAPFRKNIHFSWLSKNKKVKIKNRERADKSTGRHWPLTGASSNVKETLKLAPARWPPCK
jgi:hypothetical protein